MSQSTFVTKEEIKQARQANIAQYLLSKGVQLQKVGKRYKSKEHDSLVFTDNAYYWNSRQEHGNALDYATKHMGMDIPTAVKELSAFNKTVSKTEHQEFKINDIELSNNIQRAIAYLNKTRNIDYKIIQDLIKNKLLFQSKENSNIVFPIRNEKGDIVGAELNGTLSNKRYKGIAENSQYGYGFNLRTSKIEDIKNYMFFESTIDMLSYINIYQINGKLSDLKDTLLVSMGGLKPNIVKHTLEAFKNNHEPNVYLCVDNVMIDKAAYNFCQLTVNELKDVKVSSMICSSYPKETNRFMIEPSLGKDWNDQLSDMKKKVSIREKINEIKANQSIGSKKEVSKDNNNRHNEECL